MNRYVRTHFVGLLLAAVALVLVALKPSVGLFALPLLGGTLISNDDLIKYLIATGMCDSNGLFYTFHRDRCETLTASRTLTILDSGETFYIGAADLVVTLPAASSSTLGMRVRFVMLTAGLSAGTGFSISPNAADFITATGKTAVDDKDLINTGATDDDGDIADLVCEGADGWVARLTGTWAKEA